MANQMALPAKIYLQEFAVLEQARDDLHHELDALWTMIWEDTKPQLDDLAQADSRVVDHRPFSSEKGKHMISPRRKPKDKSAKGSVESSDKNASKLKIFVHDPRTSQTPGSYHVELRLALDAQSQIKRTSLAAPQMMEKLVHGEGLTGALNWGSGPLWNEEIKITPDDLIKTATAVSETIYKLFRVIVEFEKRIGAGKPAE